jgi:flagella basal body P-ring formation protein FlgA
VDAEQIAVQPVHEPRAVTTAGYDRNLDSRNTTNVPATAPGQATAITQLEAQRIIHWIRLALERQVPTVAENYRVEIDARQRGLLPLRSISGVTAIQPRDRIGEGNRRFHVVARSIDGSVESDVDLTLEKHPIVVVPCRTLSRGHKINAGDLTTMPLPEEELEPDFVIDADAAIGLEVRGVVRSGRPIHQKDLGSPTLIHRGDLIEVRVTSGGITVTTNAKSMGNGAASDLIEIETLQPRRRLVARVVQAGLVEIISRAPRVAP